MDATTYTIVVYNLDDSRWFVIQPKLAKKKLYPIRRINISQSCYMNQFQN